MEDLTWASWPLAALGVATVFLAGRNLWWAWVVGIITEILWLTYSWLTDQHGFMLGSLIYIAVYVNNTRRWKKGRANVDKA